jgi:hypothetical protein
MESHNQSTTVPIEAAKDDAALPIKSTEPLVETPLNGDMEEPAPSMAIIKIKTKRVSDRPTWIEVFTGQVFVVIDKLFEAQATTNTMIAELRNARQQADNLLSKSKTPSATQKQAYQQFTTDNSEQQTQLERIKTSIDAALLSYQLTPGKIWLYQWSAVILLVLCGLAEAFFIELYCAWHGAYFISLNIFSSDNINKLSNITFVNGPTTLSIAGEVLMWSSLGVWAQQSYLNVALMVRRKFRFADHGPYYIGVMMRNTSVAAAIVILLRLAKFSIFGVSLDNANPLLFDTIIGLSFLLGFFGDDAHRILNSFKNRLVKGTDDNSDRK